MMQTDRQTDYRFKILYAVGMIAVVAGHCYDGGISLFYDWFPPYSFHLGLFTFCSGFFYKETAEQSVWNYCIRKAKRLLVPLYLWNFFYAALILLLRPWGFTIGGDVTWYKLLIAPINDGHQFEYNMGGWFVVPLLMVQVFNVCLRRGLQKFSGRYKEHLLFFFCLLLGVAGIQIANAGLRTGWWLVLVRMLYFIPYFAAGIYYKRVLEKKDCLPNTVYFLFIFAMQLAIMVILQKTPKYTPSWCADFTDGPVLPYVVGFLGIALWLRIARILEPSVGKSRTVALIADNTYSIMINQFLGFMAVNAGFAMMQHMNLMSGFDVYQFKTNIWHIFLPREVGNVLIIYLIAGLALPIVMQLCINRIKTKLMRKRTI